MCFRKQLPRKMSPIQLYDHKKLPKSESILAYNNKHFLAYNNKHFLAYNNKHLLRQK